jgi:hypothetical protein
LSKLKLEKNLTCSDPPQRILSGEAKQENTNMIILKVEVHERERITHTNLAPHLNAKAHCNRICKFSNPSTEIKRCCIQFSKDKMEVK